MTRAAFTQTGFTAGELNPELYGRADLRAYGEGAATLRNVLVLATGGVARRPGLAHALDLAGTARVVPFDAASSDALLAFGNQRLDVIEAGAVAQANILAPWKAEHLDDLSFCRIGDDMLVCHGEVEPRLIGRGPDGAWRVTPWSFEQDEPRDDEGGALGTRSLRPFARYADPAVALQPVRGDQAAEEPIAQGVSVELRASAELFTAFHLHARLRVKGREVRITNVMTPSKALALTMQPLKDGLTTRDWQEEAFNNARGWPVAVTQHQDRLVLAASAAAPDRIWMSKTGRPFNFDAGEGLDDEALSFRLRSETSQRIRHLFPGRRLQVFTTTGEWVVAGQPVTPTSVSLSAQTRVGVQGRGPAPISVDGATVFVGATGTDLREFLFADSQAAYQAADLAMLAGHLMQGVKRLAFDRARRCLLALRADGSWLAITVERNSNVVAFARQDTSGRALDLFTAGGEAFFLVERGGAVALERWQDGLNADGRGGASFTHEVVPLPLASGRSGRQERRYRLIRASFRVAEGTRVRADTGRGFEPLAAPGSANPYPAPVRDVSARSLGWRAGERPAWRIEDDAAAPFKLLSVSTEIKVNQ